MIDLVDQERPDVVVLDGMPPEHRTEGLEAAIAIRDRHPTTAILLLSAHVEGHIRTIFSKLRLEPEPSDHRRVLAVLTYLRS